MKPIRLIIKAFGPFAFTEEINFEQFGANPLFLINGRTGAGKSSILDALCYALYGNTTMEMERNAAQMRCDHSDDNLLTEITLDFKLRDSLYKVTRSPVQERPKARGEGTTIHTVQGHLWEVKEDGEEKLIASRASDTTQEIEELMGLNVEQFRQVMILPQGKFRDFLNADSNKREEIFSKLFGTQFYKRIEEALGKRAKSIKKDIELLGEQIKGILEGANLSSEDEVQKELSDLKPELKTATQDKEVTAIALAKANEALTSAEQLITAFQDYDVTGNTLKNLEAEANEYQAKSNRLQKARSADSIAHLNKSLLQIKKENGELETAISGEQVTLENNKQQQEQAKSNLERAEVNLKNVAQLNIEQADLKKLLPKITEFNTATVAESEDRRSLENANSLFTRLQSDLTEVDTQIETNNARQAKIKNETVSLSKLSSDSSKLNTVVQLKKKHDELLSDQNSLVIFQAEKNTAFIAAEESVKAQESKIKKLEFSWHSNQAAILARELNDNEPCLVCGSKDHPSPATDEGKIIISKADIDSARYDENKRKTAQSAAQKALTTVETQLESLVKQIEDSSNELGENLKDSTSSLEQKLRSLTSEIKRLTDLNNELLQLDESLSELTAEQKALKQQLENARSELQDTKLKHKLTEQSRNELEKALPEKYREQGVLDDTIEKLHDEITTITKTHQQAIENKRLVDQNVTQISAKLKELKKQFKQSTQELDAANIAWTAALKESYFSDDAEFGNARLSRAAQDNLKSEIDTYNDEITSIKASLKQQKKSLGDKGMPDIDDLQNSHCDAHDHNDEAINKWSAIDGRCKGLKGVKKKLNTAHNENRALEEKYSVYGTLSEVANGKTGDKISLQRYALSLLLDDVLEEASHRLLIMSNKRYTLLRKEDKAKGNRASGLDLDVEDSYTGKTRPVSTLSGGESFMAALSLALGLSDAVQAYSGGIKLDTLFIDEGFGSLDPESLSLAISTLTELQSKGRMIGIISHVGELKEQMQMRIDVESSMTGSHVKLVGSG